MRALRLIARALSSTPALALVLAWLAWPLSALAHPRSFQLDSWPTALHLAAVHHMHWGSEIDYTYGPLGYLRFPVAYFASTMRLSLLYTALTVFALSFSLLYALRREYGAVLAGVLTLVALLLVMDERAAAVVFIWAVIALREDAPQVIRRGFPIAAGAVGALEMLVKFNGGVVALVIAGTATVAMGGRRVRNLLSLAGAFALSFLVLWLLAGQRLEDIGPYLSGSQEIVSGYSAALSRIDRDTSQQLWLALATVVIVLAMAYGAGRVRTGSRRWGVYAVWAAAAFFFFKEGFVRADTAHRPIFFGFALCALLALAADRRRLVGVLLGGAVIAVALLENLDQDPLTALTPGVQMGAAVGQLHATVSDGRRLALEAEVRKRLRRIYRLDPRTVSEIRGRSTAVMPWEFAAAYAYRLRWRPLATIQPSSAYTSYLDDHFEDGLTGRSAPQRILRSNRLTLDNRNTVWDGPSAMHAILCTFRELSATPRWQVLAREHDRCGRSVTVATVKARWGQTVNVPQPPPGQALFVDIRGVDPNGVERLRTIAYKAPPRFIRVNGAREYRLVPGTADDGLVLWVPRAADYTPPFALSQAAHTLSVRRGDGAQSRSGRITYEFEQVAIRPFAGFPT